MPINSSLIPKGHPIDYSTFYMLVVKPALKKPPFTSLQSNFFPLPIYPDDDPEQFDPSSWKNRIALCSYPREKKRRRCGFDLSLANPVGKIRQI